MYGIVDGQGSLIHKDDCQRKVIGHIFRFQFGDIWYLQLVMVFLQAKRGRVLVPDTVEEVCLLMFICHVERLNNDLLATGGWTLFDVWDQC